MGEEDEILPMAVCVTYRERKNGKCDIWEKMGVSVREKKTQMSKKKDLGDI